MSGTIRWFDAAKGFGFVIPDNGQKDCFVHRSALQGGIDSLAEGDRVQFDVANGPQGAVAENVVRITT